MRHAHGPRAARAPLAATAARLLARRTSLSFDERRVTSSAVRFARAGMTALVRAPLPTRVVVAQVGTVAAFLGIAILPVLPIALVVIPMTDGGGPPS